MVLLVLVLLLCFSLWLPFIFHFSPNSNGAFHLQIGCFIFSYKIWITAARKRESENECRIWSNFLSIWQTCNVFITHNMYATYDSHRAHTHTYSLTKWITKFRDWFPWQGSHWKITQLFSICCIFHFIFLSIWFLWCLIHIISIYFPLIINANKSRANANAGPNTHICAHTHRFGHNVLACNVAICHGRHLHLRQYHPCATTIFAYNLCHKVHDKKRSISSDFGLWNVISINSCEPINLETKYWIAGPL